MPGTTSDHRPQQTSLPSLTAWTSLCLLLPAWGPALDHPPYETVWAYTGLFGLTAAVGLDPRRRLGWSKKGPKDWLLWLEPKRDRPARPCRQLTVELLEPRLFNSSTFEISHAAFPVGDASKPTESH